MKPTIKTLALAISLLLSTAAGTLAVPVLFQVDMSGAPSFNPFTDMVDVRGDFNGWNSGAYLIPTANPYILTNVFEVSAPPGTQEPYKFTWNGSFELQNMGNRFFILGSEALTLPLAYFSDAPPPISATTNSITFRVSLATQVALGNFDPNHDTVSPAGTFQFPQWVPGLLQLTNSGANYLYIGTCTNDGNYLGTYEEFKFVINRGGMDIWETINNRSFFLTNGEVLPIVYFNNQGDPVLITFQVDLSAQAAIGKFIPGDIVECKGSFNGWSGGFYLTNDPTAVNPNLYSGTCNVFDPPGSTEYYRFTVNGGYSGLGWESPASTGGNDRAFILSGSPQTLPLVYWNDLAPSDILTTDTVVTFSVNMTNALGTDARLFDPISDTVYLNGNWLPWWNWGFPPPAYALTPNWPDTSIYSLTLTLQAGTPVSLLYKYSINGADNEAGFKVNRSRCIRAPGQYAFPTDTFGSMSLEPSFGNLQVGPLAAGRVPVTWLGRPGVHLQTTTNLSAQIVTWQDLTETDGWQSTNYPASAVHRFFRLVKP